MDDTTKRPSASLNLTLLSADQLAAGKTLGEIVGSKKVDQTQEAIGDLKRKIAEHERIIAAYEKPNAQRP